MLARRAPRRLAAALQAPTVPAPSNAPRYPLAQRYAQPRRNHSSYTSVDPTEVSHFNALASSWWDPHGPSRLLHLMNPPRHAFVRACHASQPTPPPSSLRYLDIGCGGGIFAESAARLPSTSHVTALDPSPEVLEIARAHAKRDPSLKGKLQYTQGSIEKLEVPTGEEGQFDVVSVFEVVEHVDRPAEFLERCRPFVKPGGWLVLSTIARTWVSWFTTNLVAEDILGIVPKGTHSWDKYINEDELRACFRNMGGWESPRCTGVVFVPGLGWKEVPGSEKLGNYFFAVRRESS